MSLWALLPAAASLAGTLLSKPKKKDYMLDTGYMDKYINHLRGQQVSGQVSHMIMRPALRAIGQQGARYNRRVDYSIARSGAGAGIEASMRLQGNQQALEAIERAGEKAYRAQYGENRRLAEMMGQIEMRRGQIEAQGKMAYGQAKTQWGGQVIQAGVSLGASVVGEIAATRKLKTNILEKAKSLDLIDDDTTLKDFTQTAANRGFTNTAEYVNQLARDRGTEQALNVFDPSNIPDKKAITAAVDAGEITAEYGRELLKKSIEVKNEIQQFEERGDIDLYGGEPQELIEEIQEKVASGELTDTAQAQDMINVLEGKIQQDKFVVNYSKLLENIKVDRESNPEGYSQRLAWIHSADLAYSDRMKLIEQELTFSSKLMSSFRKNVYGTYLSKTNKAEDILKHYHDKGVTDAEGDWIVSLYRDRVAKELAASKYATAQMSDEMIKASNVRKGTAVMQILRHKTLLSQTHLQGDKDLRYLDDMFNAEGLGGLNRIGSNLASIQASLKSLSNKINIDATLPGRAALMSDATPTEISDFESLDAAEKTKWLRQKWQDNIMKDVYKAIEAAKFIGVDTPQSALSLGELEWGGIPYAKEFGVPSRPLELNIFSPGLTEEDLNYWSK